MLLVSFLLHIESVGRLHSIHMPIINQACADNFLLQQQIIDFGHELLSRSSGIRCERGKFFTGGQNGSSEKLEAGLDGLGEEWLEECHKGLQDEREVQNHGGASQ